MNRLLLLDRRIRGIFLKSPLKSLWFFGTLVSFAFCGFGLWPQKKLKGTGWFSPVGTAPTDARLAERP